MIVSLAAAALLNAAAVQAAPTTDNLPNLFVSACLDGSLRLNGGEATPIQFSELPDGLRSRLGNPSASKVWKLRGAGRSYLYLLDYTSGDKKICGVAGENLALRSASAAVGTRISGKAVAVEQSRSTEWLNAGYRALATRAAGFTILQLNWLSQ